MRDSKPCNAFGLSGVTSLSYSWRNSLEERLLAWARLWCGTAPWLPLINYTVCLWNLPRHTQHTMDNQNTWYDLLQTAKKFWNRCSSLRAYDAKGNKAHKRDEVENNAGMMEDDAEKREGFSAAWIKLTLLTLDMSLQWFIKLPHECLSHTWILDILVI